MTVIPFPNQQPLISNHVTKAYHQIREIVRQAGLTPSDGENDRAMFIMLWDYFERCAPAAPPVPKRSPLKIIGVLIFAAIFIGLAHLEYLTLQHGVFHVPV